MNFRHWLRRILFVFSIQWKSLYFIEFLCDIFHFSAIAVKATERIENAPCIDNDKFYRNPNTPAYNVWSPSECAKYYLCLGNLIVSYCYVLMFSFFFYTNLLLIFILIYLQIMKYSNLNARRDYFLTWLDKYVTTKWTSIIVM